MSNSVSTFKRARHGLLNTFFYEAASLIVFEDNLRLSIVGTWKVKLELLKRVTQAMRNFEFILCVRDGTNCFEALSESVESLCYTQFGCWKSSKNSTAVAATGMFTEVTMLSH